VRRSLCYLAATALFVSVLTAAPPPMERTARAATRPPNVILIITDDQPIDTLQKMPAVRRLARRGTMFTAAVVSNSLCCPSRSTILTGLSSGHTGVWTNGDGRTRWGGWPAFQHKGVDADGTPFNGDGNNEARTVASYLRDAGYRTGLFGKYLNHYELPAGSLPSVPEGWSSWHAFVGRNGAYYGYDLNENGVLRHHGYRQTDYSTDVLGRRVRRFLSAPAVQDGSMPFFLAFTPYAPHGPPIPATRDLAVRAPISFRSPAYNERDVRDKPRYVRRTPLLSIRRRAALATRWDRMYGALRSVDRWVGRFSDALPRGVRRRTVFIFTSDNGYTWGDHRLTFKAYPYERSVRVPLIVAGPGIAHRRTNLVVENADIAPTILDLAGLSGTGGPYDGLSLVPVLRGTGTISRTAALLEHSTMHDVPSYCGVRTARWKYILYLNGFQELYNLARDPWELHNVARSRPRVRRTLRQKSLALCQPRPPDW
jgi:arylsulfatase A-like enzyme